MYHLLFFYTLCVATSRFLNMVGCSNRTRYRSFSRLRGVTKIIDDTLVFILFIIGTLSTSHVPYLKRRDVYEK